MARDEHASSVFDEFFGEFPRKSESSRELASAILSQSQRLGELERDLELCTEKLRRQRRVTNQMYVLYKRLARHASESKEVCEIIDDLGTMFNMLRDDD